MDPPAEVTSAFFHDELSRALQENGYGLMSWEIVELRKADVSTASASAKVTLMPELEQRQAGKELGTEVVVELSLKGYAVTAGRTYAALGTHFETLDDLLTAASPAFSDRRQSLLMAKLQDLATARAWEDCNDSAEKDTSTR